MFGFRPGGGDRDALGSATPPGGCTNHDGRGTPSTQGGVTATDGLLTDQVTFGRKTGRYGARHPTDRPAA